MRFSMLKGEFLSSGTAGISRTYSGIANLAAGQSYYFGFATNDFILYANPTDPTGTAVGSYFKIELLDN